MESGDGKISASRSEFSATPQGESVRKIIDTIADKKWSAGRGASRGAAPDLSLIIELDLPAALRVRAALEHQSNALVDENGVFRGDREISFAEFNERAIAWMDAALAQTGVRQLASNDAIPQLKLSNLKAPLGWLYDSTLTLAEQTKHSRGLKGFLSSCTFQESHKVKSLANPGSVVQPANVYAYLASGRRWAQGSRLLLGLADRVGPDNSALEQLFQWVFSPGSVQAILEEDPVLLRFADYREALLTGRLDPAVLDIYNCAGLVRARGSEMTTSSVLERRLAYQAASTLLNKLQSNPPKFFTAASQVTQIFGIGMVDVLESVEVDAFGSMLERVAQPHLSGDSCLALPATSRVFPSRELRQILRTINSELYHKVNLPVIHELLARDSEGHSGGHSAYFDPLTGYPMRAVEGLGGTPALEFDLRMVLTEQSYIERRLPDLLDFQSEAGRAADAVMSNMQLALYCQQILSSINTQEDSAHATLLQRTAQYLAALIQDQQIAADQARFSNYWWRVATGSAMVMALHEMESPPAFDTAVQEKQSIERFLNYFRGLISAAQAPRRQESASLSPFSPAIADEIAAILSWVPSDQEELRRTLHWTAQLLLDTEFATRRFWGCEANQILQTPIHNPVNAQTRATAIFKSAGDLLALTYELAEGGALHSVAEGDKAPDPSLCDLLDRRRKQLNAILSRDETALAPFDINAAVIVFDESLDLRKRLGPLQAFLLKQRDSLYAQFGSEHVVALLDQALELELVWQRRTSMIELLKTQPGAVLAAAGLDATRLSELADKLAATNVEKGQLPSKDDTATYEELFGLAKRKADLDAYEQELDDLFKNFERNAEVAPGSPLALSAARYAQMAGQAAALVETAQATLHTLTDRESQQQLASHLLGGQVGITLEQTGVGPNKQARHSARLFVKKPTLLPTQGGVSLGCAVSNGQGGCADLGVLFNPTRPDVAEVLDLGIELSNVELGDCVLAELQSCSLKVVNAGNVNQLTNQMPQTFPDVFKHLEIPEFIQFEPRTIVIANNRTLEQIKVRGRLSIAGLVFDDFIFPLREESQFLDFRESFIRHAQSRIQTDATTALGNAASTLASVRLPAAIDEWRNAPIRFGPALTADGRSDITLDIDWNGALVSMNARYELRVVEAAVTAQVALQWGPSGWQFSDVKFDTTEFDALANQLAKLDAFARVRELANGKLRLEPHFIGDRLSLSVAIQYELQGCPLTLSARIPIDSATPFHFQGIDSLLSQDIAQLGKGVESCAAAQLTRKVSDYFDAKAITVLGVPFEVEFDAAAPKSTLEASGVPVILTLAAHSRGHGQALGECKALSGPEIKGIRLGAQGIDMRGMRATDQERLGAVLKCRLETAMPPSLRQHLLLGNIQAGHNVLAVDMVLKDLPIFGTVALPRQNLLDLEADPAQTLLHIFAATSGDLLAQQLQETIGTEPISIAGLGTLSLQKGQAVQIHCLLSCEGKSPSIDVPVHISAGPLKNLPGTLTVRLGAGGEPFSFGIDGKAIQDQLISSALQPLVTLLGSKVFEFENLQFARLDDHGRRWGLVFGLKVGLPLGGHVLSLESERVVVSEKGVSLEGELRGSHPTAIYMGPVAMSRMLISVYEPSGTRRGTLGLKIGAELTAFEPSLAHVLKVQSILDLGNIERPSFTLTGDLIAFNRIKLIEATGLLDLAVGKASLDARTVPMLRGIIDHQMQLEMSARDKLLAAESGLRILGVPMNKATLAFCVSECKTPNPERGMARLKVHQNLGFGGGEFNAATDLDFRNPHLGAGVALNLFGWEPGISARFNASLKNATVGMSFLGVGVTAETATAREMTPQLLLDLLRSLLDIKLEDLLKIKKIDDIKLSRIGKNGKISHSRAANSKERAPDEINGGGRNENSKSDHERREISIKQWQTAKGHYYCQVGTLGGYSAGLYSRPEDGKTRFMAFISRANADRICGSAIGDGQQALKVEVAGTDYYNII